jgi:hypothetical protein
MGTLKGFPNPPALWLRRAQPGYAYAIEWEPSKGSQTLPRFGSAGHSPATPTRLNGNPLRLRSALGTRPWALTDVRPTSLHAYTLTRLASN